MVGGTLPFFPTKRITFENGMSRTQEYYYSVKFARNGNDWKTGGNVVLVYSPGETNHQVQ